MPFDVKSAAARPRSTYRTVRSSAVQVRGMLRERGVRATGRAIAGQLRQGRYAPRGTALMAVTAAFKAGQDDTVEATLADMELRYPYSAAVHELRADLLAFRGDGVGALDAARLARLLEPSRGAAIAREVRYSYAALDRDRADEVAIEALHRMPRHSAVLWAVGKGCASAEQADRIVAAWKEQVHDPAALPAAVRQLASAAARGKRADVASDLYRDGITALHASGATLKNVRTKQLLGKGAWNAIEDLTSLLDDAGVPFFFAAGTALGLVREGRPLDLDGDIDIGVFDGDWDRDAFAELIRTDPRFILDPNPMSGKVALKHRGGSPIDIFRYYEDDGQVWHDGVFVRWWNTPFKVVRHEIRGIQLPIPEDADLYLSENYGDWRTPNPGYDVFTEAPNYVVHWPEYAHMHLLRSAFVALSGGHREAAIEWLRRANESDLVELLSAEPGERAARVRSDRKITPQSSSAAAAGDDRTIADVDAAIRRGGWSNPVLWHELADLADGPEAYAVVRTLWFDSPEPCARNVAILRAVAGAAASADDHVVARTLAGSATARAFRRARASTRRALTRGAPSQADASGNADEVAESDRERTVTAAHIELLDGIMNDRRDVVRRAADVLRRNGESGWLGAL